MKNNADALIFHTALCAASITKLLFIAEPNKIWLAIPPDIKMPAEMEISMENSSNKKDESTYVFDKSMNCPVCDADFKTKQVKTGKARFLGTEADLRPLYSGIDTIKYDVCLCPKCGYASTLREFNNVTPKQRALLKEMIGSKYTAMEDSADYYTYDIAIKRYKMALLTAMTKPARGSEQAYLCLKLAWLYRGAAEDYSRMIQPI